MLLCIRTWKGNNDVQDSFVGFLFSNKLVILRNEDLASIWEYRSQEGSIFRFFAPDEASNGKMIAIGCSNKKVLLVDFDSKALVDEFKIPKTITSLIFRGQVLISKNSGNVFTYSLETKNLDCILGHLSIVTEICLDLERKLVFSADKDQKIRVSRFPCAFVIENFLLAHESFVSKITLSPNGKFLVSGGGDAFLCLWQVGNNFACMQKIPIEFASEDSNMKICNVALVVGKNVILAAFEASCWIYSSEYANLESLWKPMKPFKKFSSQPNSISIDNLENVWISCIGKENFIWKNYQPFTMKELEIDYAECEEPISMVHSWEKLSKKLGFSSQCEEEEEREEEEQERKEEEMQKASNQKPKKSKVL